MHHSPEHLSIPHHGEHCVVFLVKGDDSDGFRRTMRMVESFPDLTAHRKAILAVHGKIPEHELAEASTRVAVVSGASETESLKNALARCRELKQHALVCCLPELYDPALARELARTIEATPLAGFALPNRDFVRLGCRAVSSACAHSMAAAGFQGIEIVHPTIADLVMISRRLLADSQPIDTSYRLAEYALADFALRSNAFGFVTLRSRIARPLANAPARETHFIKEGCDWRLLTKRYPDAVQVLATHSDPIQFATEGFLDEIGKVTVDKPRILIDLAGLSLRNDGTSELAVKLCRALSREAGDSYDVVLCGLPDALAFHGLSDLCATETSGPIYGTVSFRFGVPSKREKSQLFAAIQGIFLLDTIALNALYLGGANSRASVSALLANYEFALYCSEFTFQQFKIAFGDHLPSNSTAVLLPTDITDYATSSKSGSPKHILLLGNDFAHKNVHATVEQISHIPMPVKVLGSRTIKSSGNVEVIHSGHTAQHVVDQLYADAACVVFPSFVEGFGFPIMHALANQVPVICRDLPVFAEIAAHTRYSANIHMRSSTADIVQAIETVLETGWVEPTNPANDEFDWSHVARALLGSINEEIAAFDARRIADKLSPTGGMSVRRPPVPLLETVLFGLRKFRAVRSIFKMMAPYINTARLRRGH